MAVVGQASVGSGGKLATLNTAFLDTFRITLGVSMVEVDRPGARRTFVLTVGTQTLGF